MPAYSSLKQPVSLRRRFVLLSVLLHAALVVLVLASPRMFSRKIKRISPKFFQVVNVSLSRPKPAAHRPKPQRRKPSTPAKKPEAKPKAAPALRAGVTETQPKAAQPPEPLLPTHVQVRNAGFQYDWYLSHLMSKVERYWQPPRGLPGEEDLTVEVFFHILRNGSISNLSVQQSSGNETLDRLGLRTIRRASPFPRLPPRFVESELRVTFKLNYLR